MQRLEKERATPMEGKQPWTLTYEVCDVVNTRDLLDLLACRALKVAINLHRYQPCSRASSSSFHVP